MPLSRASILAAAAVLLAIPGAAHGSTPTIPPADRHAIRVLLGAFVPAAVGRHDPGSAYSLATPSMRAGTTRADWRHGRLPVVPYPIRPGRYGIRPTAVDENDILLDLMLQPRAGSKAGAVVYTTEVRRINGRWLVDSMYPTAQFSGPQSRPSVTAEPDLAPGKGDPGRPALARHWILLPIAIIALPLLLAPIALAVVWFRGRRSRAGTDARATIPWR